MRDLRIAPEPSAHLHSIHIDPELLDEFERRGFMFGIKLSFNLRFLGMTRSLELFQSIDNGSVGCLDQEGKWIRGAVFYRRTLTYGKFKWYVSQGIVLDCQMVNCEVGCS